MKKTAEKEWKLREMWDTIKHTSILIMGDPEGEEKEKGTLRTFEKILAENFPNLMSSINIKKLNKHQPRGTQRDAHGDTL